MVVLRYLKSYIQPVPSVQIVGTVQRDISRKSSDIKGRWGEVGGGGGLAVGIIFSPSMTSRRSPQPERLELVQ